MPQRVSAEGWKTIRFAIRGWGTTVRLIAVILSIGGSASIAGLLVTSLFR